MMYSIGCQSCDCHTIGSYGYCDPVSGLCECKAGVTGVKCDACAQYHYGLSQEGCRGERAISIIIIIIIIIIIAECNCSLIGSSDLQCNDDGVCQCRDGVFGDKCDTCKENYFINASSAVCTGKE